MIETQKKVQWIHEGAKIHLVIDGKVIGSGHWTQFEAMCRAGIRACKQAEEYEQHDRMATDQALLLRTGAPFGMATRPDVMELAKHKAVNDREIRKKVLPMQGVKAKEVIYGPKILQTKPNFDGMTPHEKATLLKRMNPGLNIAVREKT